MEKKYQVFISSTYKDLIEARSKVRDAILSMMHFPVGMEMFNAADEEQWEIIQETIDSSDYYVLILGQRYGSVIESVFIRKDGFVREEQYVFTQSGRKLVYRNQHRNWYCENNEWLYTV